MATILPSINLKDHEVRDMLNKHGGRANNTFGSKFKPSADIPAFAKYKPVEYPGINPYHIGEWWKSIDLSCQIQINFATTLKELEEMFESDNKGWTYKYFSPNEEYPWRSGDWRGHNPEARSVVGSIDYDGTVEVTTSGTTNVWITVHYRQQADSELKFSDISYNLGGDTMDGWYLGFVYKTSKDSTLKIVTTNATINYESINETVLLPVMAYNSGTMTIYPVMSQYSYPTAVDIINQGTYICPLPDSDIISVEVVVRNPIVITLDETASFFAITNTSTYELHATYNIESEQNVQLTGHWYYTAVNADREPIGERVVDPRNGDDGWVINTGTGNSSQEYVGQSMYIPGCEDERFAGIRVEYISEGYNFGGHVFNFQ